MNIEAGINRRLSREEVISRAIEVHGAKYDYSKVEYNTIEDRITIICPEHGEFQQIANNHINQGYGCNQCGHVDTGLKRRISGDKWLSRFKQIHGYTYDYSEFESRAAHQLSKIICKEHGLFLQSPITHSNGVGCPDCGRDKAALQRRLSQDDVLDRFREVHGETYDYSLVEYVVSQENLTIICKKHGPFEQLTHVHANGSGCPKCSSISAGLKRRLTINDVFERFREAHGERFDYSKFVYQGDRAKATIICRKHGPFEQNPADHWTSVHGCARCAGKDQTTEGMIEQFRKTHGDWYDYSNFIYRGNKVHSTIICNDHGPFEQVPHAHRSGQGCPKCGILKQADKRRLSNEEILQKFREVHGDRYDYSRVEYTGRMDNVTIVCEKHGPFEQAPNNHLAGQNCPVCGRIILSEKSKLNPEQVLERFEKVHGNTYDYSRVEYTGTQNNVTIVCEKHGPFEQAPNSHLAGSGCPVCGRISLSEKSTHTQEQVIGKFREIHGDTYDYSRVEYSGNSIKVTIVCHEHGSFEQPPSSHKSGQGCPDCSTLGFRNNQPGYYYCLSILGHGGHWWFKGGISGDPQRRAGQIQSSLRGSGLLLDVIVVDSIRFERGIDARNLESKLLKVEGIRTFTIERFDGSRELFSNNPIEFAKAKGWT
jgi:Zn finger protein HypA/HybF involved in hydrogenase expression